MRSDEEQRLLERLPASPGLCATCEHLRLLASPRSVFVRCGLADVDPAFPRYPPLPVLACAGYEPHSEEKPAARTKPLPSGRDNLPSPGGPSPSPGEPSPLPGGPFPSPGGTVLLGRGKARSRGEAPS